MSDGPVMSPDDFYADPFARDEPADGWPTSCVCLPEPETPADCTCGFLGASPRADAAALDAGCLPPVPGAAAPPT